MGTFNNTGDSNDPTDWFTSDYGFSANNLTLPIDVSVTVGGTSQNAKANTGITDADLLETTGDVRAVYLALAETLFLAYQAKQDTSTTTHGSNRLKMSRSQTIDTTNNKRHTVYTIAIQEDGTPTAESFASSGVASE
jgi:hypothetical protein